MENNELQHWGIKGMKWGVRRYQNSDGTLTAAGKKRYARELAKLKAEKKILENKRKTQAKYDKLDVMRKENEAMKSGKKTVSDDGAPAKKSIKDMSDKELATATARLQAEKSYKDAYAAMHPETISRGKKLVDKFLDNVVEKAPDLAVNLANDYIDDRARKVLGLKKTDDTSASAKLKQALEDAKNKRDLDDLNDKAYQKLKREAEEAKLRGEINKNKPDEKANTETKTDAKTEPKQEKKTDTKSESKKETTTETKSKPKDEQKAYKGTVVGEGTSKGSSKKSDKGPVIDVDWTDVGVSNVPAVYTRPGQSYSNRYLELYGNRRLSLPK